MDWTCGKNVSGRIVKNIFESKSEGNIRKERRRLRWLEYVGLREVEVKRWRQKAVFREEWASVIKEATGLRRP